VPERATKGIWVWLLSAGVPLLGVVAGIRVATSESRLSHALAAAAVMTGLSFIVVPTRSGIRMTPVVSTIAALPFVRSADGDPMFDLVTGIAVVAIGSAAVWVVRTARGDEPVSVLSDSLRTMLAGGLYLFVFDRLGAWLLAGSISERSGWPADLWQVVALALVIPLWFLIEAMVVAAPVGWKHMHRGTLELRDFDIHVTLIATGALFGLSFEVIGWFAIAIVGLPFMFALGAFRRLAEMRLTYAQTVRALAQIPEAAGHVQPGHAVRVKALAGAVARDLGLRPTAVEEVEWAAYLHDIGRISLNDPGVVKIGYTEADIAEWGSVIAEEATLNDVATVIRRQHEPYRRPGQLPDPDLPVASRIIKVCSAYDELVGEEGMFPLEALEQLHRGSVYDFDPDIVNTVRSILESTDSLTPRR
jgi:hypothetical protein